MANIVVLADADGTLPAMNKQTSQTPSPGDIGPLAWSGRFAGGLMADIRRRGPFYKSDWLDAIIPGNRAKTLSSTCFIFFAALAAALSFGALFSEFTDQQLGASETILASSISGIAYAFFAGQPIAVLGATGPELAYTLVFFNMCEQFGVEFLPARVWQGLWCALFTILLALFDCCALMRHVTRFTEEIFSALIALLYIYEALLSLVKMYTEGGHSRASAFLATILCFCTYGAAMKLRAMKKGALMTPTIRGILGDYGVTISIITFSVIAYIFREETPVPMLDVPLTFRPTWTNPETGLPRAWLVNPMGINKDFPMWAIFATIIPALGLTFLGYMDQNLTSLLVNRKDHNLKKPAAYHLDLLVCGVCVYPVCALLGLPFTHAATVRSLAHLISLTNYETVELDGGGTTTRVHSVLEQRVTMLAIHILLALSLVMAPALILIPKSVLFGVFLYMGFTSMVGNDLFDRLFLWGIWRRAKYPQFDYVKSVSFKRMHCFTAFQVGCMVVLFAMTRIDAASVAFPFLIGLLVPVRTHLLPKIFTTEELAALDK